MAWQCQSDSRSRPGHRTAACRSDLIYVYAVRAIPSALSLTLQHSSKVSAKFHFWGNFPKCVALGMRKGWVLFQRSSRTKRRALLCELDGLGRLDSPSEWDGSCCSFAGNWITFSLAPSLPTMHCVRWMAWHYSSLDSSHNIVIAYEFELVSLAYPDENNRCGGQQQHVSAKFAKQSANEQTSAKNESCKQASKCERLGHGITAHSAAVDDCRWHSRARGELGPTFFLQACVGCCHSTVA